MNKQYFVGNVWLLLSFLFTVIGINITPVTTPIQILIFLACMLISAPISIAIGHFVFKKPKYRFQEKITFHPDLPLSGTIQGPRFGLPRGTVITYSDALKSPVISIHRYPDSTRRGFSVDFGNGKVSYLDGQTSSEDCRLPVTMIGDFGVFQVNC